MAQGQDGDGAGNTPAPPDVRAASAESEELDLAAEDLSRSIAAETVPDRILWLARRMAARMREEEATDPAPDPRD